jgi:hypothetical protein
MRDAYGWKPRLGESLHPFPGQRVLLAAALQCLPPHPLKLVPKRTQ